MNEGVQSFKQTLEEDALDIMCSAFEAAGRWVTPHLRRDVLTPGSSLPGCFKPGGIDRNR